MKKLISLRDKLFYTRKIDISNLIVYNLIV
ncbi:hypothetical protein NRS6103_07000 [Bacillus subtilis]|nr:hypothetical protein OB04_01416 [Bacillus subtilis]PLV37922.1 hypothetical protein BSP2_19870 [Bacillus subtilis subsp. subtilis]CAF1752870.1 hypothetical protein NRS6103_02640 [Bacillus subtilis]CAF1793466.1 hypothetical protein NRS6128_00472 [Bacillus subtilis]CAF1826363.1 hypothetical protein NRS6127_02696 [Bacillus subtilis]